MKHVVTNYSGTTEILKFPDHYVAVSVMVSDSGVIANADGKKIVPKGTVVGGISASVLADATQKVTKKNTVSVAATKTLEPVGEDNDLTITAVSVGIAGNAIKVELRDPAGNSKALAVSIEGTTIVASLATDGTGAITSTAAEVRDAINAHLLAKQLVVASLPGTQTGAGVVTAIAATALAGGTAGTALGAEGVLLNDVDVTYGAHPGAMVVHGYVNSGKLPEAVSAEAKAALKGITFLQ